MADIKKFLDQAGVGTLWKRVAEEVSKVDEKVAQNAADIEAAEARLTTAESKIDALEAGTYDDTAVRGLIASNTENITKNTNAIALLNGDAETTGSVANTATVIAAAEVAKIVAEAPESYDTLKEIADWIANDTTGAAQMANDITELQGLVGDKAVATQIANAIDEALKIEVEGEKVDKYALATELNALAEDVKALEDAGYLDADAVNAAIDAKITALDLANTYDAKGAATTAETNAKAYADGLNTAMDARVATLEAIDHDKILTDANAYTDNEINTKIVALSANEIDAAIATAKEEMAEEAAQ